MEELQARHRKEQKDLQSRITQKKKQASKKTRKGVNDECERLEVELRERQQGERAALGGEGEGDDGVAGLDDLADDHTEEPNGVEVTQAPPNATNDPPPPNPPTEPPQLRKPNRQKARLARRAAEQEESASLAALEAQNLPDLKAQERERMLSYMTEHNLTEKEIRADGHCLYSAIADQLCHLSIPLGASKSSREGYKLTRAAAADWIESHAEDFEPFLEEDLGLYVEKIRETGEWGGEVELRALARCYGVGIRVLRDFGRVEVFEPEGGGEGRGECWLAYYRRGFGLGEHYNSLRRGG